MSQMTQPICFTCWNERNPLRSPSKVAFFEEENCAICNTKTTDGIYVRITPDALKKAISDHENKVMDNINKCETDA